MPRYIPEEDEEERDENERRRVNRLRTIETPIVSPVKRGANRGRFILKNEEGKMPGEVKKDEWGNPIQNQPAGGGDPPEGTAKDNPPEGGAQPADKADKMPGGVKSKVSAMLTSVVERAKSLLAKVQGIAEDDKAEKPIPSAVEQEVKAIAAAANGVLEKYPAPKSGTTGDAGAADGKDAADPKPATKEAAFEMAAEEIVKAADLGGVPLKQRKAFRKLFVSMRKFMDAIDPEAKEAMKQFDIVLKSAVGEEGTESEALRGAMEDQTEVTKALMAEVAALKDQLGKKSEAIAKMDSMVPDGNSDQYAAGGPAPAAPEQGAESDWHFGGWDPQEELKKQEQKK